MKTITVLGAGSVGSLVAEEMSRDYRVISVDRDSKNLSRIKGKKNIVALQGDLTDEAETLRAVSGSDLAILALPGSFGYQTLKTLIKTGVDTVDISFFEEDPFSLEDLAKDKGIQFSVDCGVAPGLCNIILGRHAAMENVHSYSCMVGGLVRARHLPYEYKSVFSPSDVIAEYVREARIVEDNQLKIKPALSAPEFLEFEGVGTLVAFNTDGLRTLIKTMKIPFMSEKTLRYPKTYEYLKVLKDSGFFSDREITVQGKSIKPCDVSEILLSGIWKISTEDRDMTLMKIQIETSEKSVYTYTISDFYDEKENRLSMARTTGFTCCAVSRLFLEDRIEGEGLITPEQIGSSKSNFEFVVEYLKNKNIKIELDEFKNSVKLENLAK
ncbi:saccharopine dehydrogenase NADP-binding domain-containing protein [candidate division WOR-3 bacterium]|nr:saccharopine dehydrogenase NADP-binding domain-containing protein [candidate division WOR-3 bacterium]